MIVQGCLSTVDRGSKLKTAGAVLFTTILAVQLSCARDVSEECDAPANESKQQGTLPKDDVSHDRDGTAHDATRQMQIAKDEVPQDRGRGANESESLFPFPEMAIERIKELEAEVPSWIEGLDDFDAQVQANCVAALFGGTGLAPSDEVEKLLKARKLRYSSWQARSAALFHFSFLLEDNFDELMPIFRDGLNDPHPKVRAMAAGSLIYALDAAIESKRDDRIDEIVDLVLSKGLVDKNADVAFGAHCIIHTEQLVPTEIRFRALDRALATGRVHKDIRAAANLLHTDWKIVVYGLKRSPEPDDPFADPAGDTQE